MVSNDDIDFSVTQSVLQDLKIDTDFGLNAAHSYTVPNGRKWNVIAAYMQQSLNEQVSIKLVDTVINEIIIHEDTITRSAFLPQIKITLREGWLIRFDFAPSMVPRTMISTLLIEEEPLY